MDSFQGPCPHRSVPVEMDERMTFSTLDSSLLPSCQQCSGHAEPTQTPQDDRLEPTGGSSPVPDGWKYPEAQRQHMDQHQQRPFISPRPSGLQRPPHPAGVQPPPCREEVLYEPDPQVNHGRGFAGPSNWSQDYSVEQAERLEPPLPLMSDYNCTHVVPPRHPAHLPAPGHDPVQGICSRQYACLPRHNHNYCHYNNNDHPVDPHQTPRRVQHASVPAPQRASPPTDTMQEVSVSPSVQARPGAAVTGIRTISLPVEYRKVFITYSLDTATEMIPFTKFLIGQGFNATIDIFDSRLRGMGITRWMDQFLNDKSVLIIVVISPKYKEDVEGGSDDDHGLHTKYIHTQLQSEFIQAGCLNFRVVPVLFPSATKSDVPNWLRNTRIFRWPQDFQDLLLRLLREERYVAPRVGANLTLTIRPL